MTSNTDVIVIGGGPAGSTVSTLIAQKGHKVRLFERAKFPRFHIGESLIPETYWVLKRLNMLDKLRRSAFVKKVSVQFVGQSGRLSEPFYFTDHNPHECSQTWQVLRSEFDQMMLDNAREHGVQVHEGARVREVLFEELESSIANCKSQIANPPSLPTWHSPVQGQNPQAETPPQDPRSLDHLRAVGVRVTHDDGTDEEIRAKVVIDASGQSALIGNRFGLLVKDTSLKKGAVWTYWKGAYRDPGRDEGATIVLQTKGKKGWFWYIPLHNNIVSVGIVRAFDELFSGGRDHETIYNEELDNCPEVKRRVLMGARCDKFYATKDYSYRATRNAGHGWALIGDAFGFLDPLYSSGVLLALKSGQLAADNVCEALASNDTSATQLGKWGPDFCKGMDRMRRLVCEYYDGFSFGRFVQKHPHLKGHLTDLLIGNLFTDHVEEVFPRMDEMRAQHPATPSATFPQ